MDYLTMDQRIKQIFEKYFSRPALCFNGITITYFELSQRCASLTEKIYSYTNGKSYPIAFKIGRGIDSVVAMLSIILANCYYVPLDPTYPAERINHIINDIGPHLFLSDDFNISSACDTEDRIRRSGSSHNINVSKITVNELAYIIYTSGSTGLPKGVIISQVSLLNLIDSAIKRCHVTENSRVFHFTSIGFDAAGWDIYLSFFSGATLYIATDELSINPPACHQFIMDNKLTMVTLTPSFLSQMPMIAIPSLESLVVMGELSDLKYMDWWSKHTTVYNGYGPTECCIGSTIHIYKEGDSPNNIGFPFDGYTVHILDDNLNETDEGQICIGGIGVAIGYHNLPEKTKEKFINLRYGKLYLTGDLGKRLPNDEIAIVGRSDNQVKVNGIRIELEEIESLAMKIENIERACCVFRDQKIHLFYQSNQKVPPIIFRIFFTARLHRSVVPLTYTRIDKFTLTVNGKIDRKLLMNKIPVMENTETGSFNSTETVVETVNVSPKLPFVRSEKIIMDAYSKVFNVPVSVSTNYFEIGGTSLDTHRVLSILQQNGIHIKALDIMKYPVISDLAGFIKTIIPKEITLTKKILSDYYPVTPFQLNLWKHRKVHPEDASYNNASVYIFRNIDLETLQNRVYGMIKKHPALRTRYIQKNALLQKFDQVVFINIKSGVENIIDDIKTSLKIPFNLEQDQLIRVTIYLTNNFIFLAIIKDGSISDAYSENIIIRELKGLDTENDPFIDILDDVNAEFNNNNSFWEEYLKEPFYHPIPKYITSTVQHFHRTINLPKKSSETTPFVLAVTAMGLMLQKYTGNNNVVFGTQFAIRDDSRLMNTIGFLVSTLLLRLDMSQSSLIKYIHETYLKVSQNKFVTYETLMDLWKNPVEVMFVYQNLLTESIEEIKIENDSVPFPITWYVYQNSDQLTINVKTCYEPKMINGMIDMFMGFLQDINIPSKSSILKGPDMEIPNITINQIIDEACNQYGNKSAIKYSSETADFLDMKMTYSGLQRLVNIRASYLMKTFGIGLKSRVGISLRKSVDFVIMLLAVLKVGAHYVPIDPDYPEERIQYMVMDCCPQLIITRDSYKINFNHGCVIDMDQFIMDSCNITVVPFPEFSNDEIAYIIYTSGSTGNPKACMITHKSVINVCNHFKMILGVTTVDKIWTHTTISFDIMVLELLLPLFSGAKLLVCPQCVSSNPVSHVKWINDNQPSIIQATPTQFSLIGKHLNIFLTKFLVGGEQLNSNLAATLLSKTKEVYNVYGPSETTVWSSVKKINDHVNIGSPISNTICMVNAPEYVTGELLIGGAGVAKGYYNKPGITAERFINYQNEIYYKTGDLVKIINGEIEYVGRNDFQVKIRGHRVELEEIIKVADSFDNIIRSCIRVFDLESIVLYIISGVSVITDDMYRYLRMKLPKHAIPSFIIQLPRFPETLNGKIDTKLLPDPRSNSLIRYTYHKKYIAPRNETENLVSQIICDILQLSEISADESFLNVGFTSINVYPLIMRINEMFVVTLTGELVYEYSTVESLAKYIKTKK